MTTNEQHVAACLDYFGPDFDGDPNDFQVYEGRLTDYVAEWAEDCGLLPTEFSRQYFDAEQYALDLWLGGDVVALFDHGTLRDRSIVQATYGVWFVNVNDF